jgi:hypothetical protein
LRMQNQYWRQRFTQRMTQFGDENTKFFHSMATERFRKNVISQIMDDTGTMVSSHEEKVSGTALRVPLNNWEIPT